MLSTTLTVKVRVMALQAPVANCTILTLQHNSHSTGNTEPLINAVVNCFWRTPKSAVINELSIMKPITIVKRLEFSQIERDFYQRQADKCKESIRLHFAKVNRDAKMADLSHTTRLIAFNLALKLRKTCCHPQICSNQFFMNSNKKFQSLEDVLDKMIEDMKYESEKSHREKIAAMNGKSGILLLKVWRIFGFLLCDK